MTKSCAFVTHEGAAPSARQRREKDRERVREGGGRRPFSIREKERSFCRSLPHGKYADTFHRGVPRFSGNM